MKNGFEAAAFLLAIAIAASSGCVQAGYNATEAGGNDSGKGGKAGFYVAVNYTAQESIFPEPTGYPTIIDNPVMTNPVRFYVNESAINYSYSVFYPEMASDAIEGMKKWTNATGGRLQLIETKDAAEAAVIVNFVRNYGISNVTSTEYGISWVQQQGEGGPTRYSEYRGFGVIEKSAIYVFPQKDNRCETVQLAEHEFGHAMGLGHEDDLRSVMFRRSNEYCNQIFTPKLLAALDGLYKNAKPDLRFKSVSAVRHDEINITFEVVNIGLSGSREVGLWISDGSFVKEAAEIPALGPGESATISAGFRPTIDRGILHAYIDIGGEQEEISSDDNSITLAMEPGG